METRNSLHSHPCYFGNITRELATTLLENRALVKGTFLVRRGKNGYRISAWNGKNEAIKVLHYIINVNFEKKYFVDDNKHFSTVLDLISFYHDNPNEGLYLTEVCGKSGLTYGEPKNQKQPRVKKLKKDDVSLKTMFTSGVFAETWKGVLHHKENVVVKISNKSSDSSRFLLEQADILNDLSHKNIVHFRGFVYDEYPYLVFEFCENKDLLDYLFRCGDYQEPKADYIAIAEQVADGLQYICESNLVHRNVKAANIMVTKDCVCKLGSFDYAAKLNEHKLYVEVNDDQSFKPNAVRWMALEASEKRVFSTASDVWSYACMIIELFTQGEIPFIGVLTQHVLKTVQSGLRPSRPKIMPCFLYNLLMRCWRPQPERRPDFIEIKKTLGQVKTSLISSQPAIAPELKKIDEIEKKTVGKNVSKTKQILSNAYRIEVTV